MEAKQMTDKPHRKIGIMGGTFDPIHNGHLLIAQTALDEFSLDEVIFVPTGKSPHKKESQVTEPSIRCEMTRLAIADRPGFSISEYEATNTDVNYTYKTLQAFKAMYPEDELFFIMGEDSIDYFTEWREPAQICKLATLLVAVRNNGKNTIDDVIASIQHKYSAKAYKLHSPNFEAASREIRLRIKNSKSVENMLPEAVLEYILTSGLYKSFEI